MKRQREVREWRKIVLAIQQNKSREIDVWDIAMRGAPKFQKSNTALNEKAYTQNRCIRVVARLVAGIHLPDLLEGNHCRANAQQNRTDCQRGDGDGTDLQVEEKLMNCQHKKRLPDLKMFVECLVRETLDFFELCYNYYHIREQTALLLVGLPEDDFLGIGEERLLLPAKRKISQDE